MVKLHSSSVFVKDPVDVWGKEHTIGNAELAARLGSPATFDRRGTVVIYDDFESSPLKWSDGSVGSGASATLSNEYPLRGSGCIKLVAPVAATYYANAFRFIGGLANGRMGLEATIRMNTDVKTLVGISMRAWTGSRAVYSGISIQGKTDGGLKYLSGNAPVDSTSWTTFDTSDDIWMGVSYPIKFVVDLDDEKYVRCMFNGKEIDMSGYSPHCSDNTSPKLIYLHLVAISVGAAETSHIDNVVLTINEPE